MMLQYVAVFYDTEEHTGYHKDSEGDEFYDAEEPTEKDKQENKTWLGKVGEILDNLV